MKYFVIFLTLLCILPISFSESFAELLNQKSYSFDAQDGIHEIKLQSSVTKFKDVFYDNQAHSIIIHTASDSKITDNVLIYLHESSFESLLGDGIMLNPYDIYVLLDGEEEKYDVAPTAPRNNYVVWEFKNKPNTTEIELILKPERYRDDTSSLTGFEESFSITEKQVRYEVFYNVTNATISNVQLDCNSPSLTLSILTDSDGVVQLDIPKGMFGGIFMILVDDEEWDDVSIDGNVLTVNFTEDASTIKILGTYNLSTSVNDGVCDVIHNPPHSHIILPLKQFKSGITIDEIKCKDNLVLILKYDDFPACVKPETVSKLVTREWGTSDNWIKLSNAYESIHYELDGGKFISVDAFSEYANPSLPEENKQTWLKIKLESTRDGSLQVTLPRNLIDSKINDIDDGFFVLLDGVETEYLETKTEYERILEFSFTSETDIVEIVGYGYYNSELSPFDGEYLSELDKQCNIDKPGSKWNDAEQLCVYANTAIVGGHKIYDSKLIHNKENKYCISVDEGLSDQCHSLEEIVFGDARRNWTVYPGGAGWMPPDDSELTRIYKEVEFGMRPLNFTAMLDDEIFVNKCESNGGTWNYAYHDCEGLWEVCKGAGGINVEEDVTPYCDPLVGCNASKLVRVSCVFEYEN